MSPEEQRIAIAKACGWKEVYFRPSDHFGSAWLAGIDPNPDEIVGIIDAETGEERKPTEEDYSRPTNIPDYIHDLNAMHEAEKTLLRLDYGPLYGERLDGNWHATAAQRAEAFLRELNLWTK